MFSDQGRPHTLIEGEGNDPTKEGAGEGRIQHPALKNFQNSNKVDERRNQIKINGREKRKKSNKSGKFGNLEKARKLQ